MTISLFIAILTAGSILSGVLTEAIKKCYNNAGKSYSANVIALINAIVIGGGGTVASYMLLGIDWTVNNIICIIGVMFAVWVGAMLGYDKVLQTVKQIATMEEKEECQ